MFGGGSVVEAVELEVLLRVFDVRLKVIENENLI